MDVLCVGMYRACSTWQYEVVAHLLERHRGGRRLGYLTGPEYDDLVHREGPARESPWAVVKSHEEHRRFRRSIDEGRAAAIYAHRDVRDVVFSLMHKRALTFEAILARGMIHQVLANDRFWSTRPGLLIQRYDRLVAEPVRGVEQLAAHLGLTLRPGEAAEVAAEYSFEANRKRVDALGRTLRDTGGNLDAPEFVQVYDPKTLLHWNHLRDGRVGDWRSLATPRQVAALAMIAGDWLVAHGYEPDDRWAGPPWTLSISERARLRLDVARGAMVCRLRCLALRHPEAARVAKRLAMITDEAPPARAASEAGSGRVDGAHSGRGPSPRPESVSSG